MRCGNFGACGKTVVDGPGTGLCTACWSVAYCSRECQAADWAMHKAQCDTLRNSKAMATAPMSVTYALPPFAPSLAAAEAGDADAQYHVAGAYASGIGVAQSWPSAFLWYKRCAAQPSPPIGVWVHLGQCYECGNGVAVDEVEAVRLYRVGAALGHAAAQFQLGQCLLRVIGVATPDRDGAFALFTAAAAQDHPEALYGLAGCYKTGAGVAQDVSHAVSLWKRALAHPRCPVWAATAAAHNLGAEYWNGVGGVARDHVVAVCYWWQAVALGDETAARMLRELGLG